MIPFFITIDTEGDALWDDPQIENIKTENVLWIPRFQELCEKYNFKPIWLTDYEIIMDDRFVHYIKEKNKKGLCEVGIHLHAHNNPPLMKLENEKESGAAYLIEYPYDVMKEKFLYLKELLERHLECKILTHRAGRWALNQEYWKLLNEVGIKYDCSVTPGINWSHAEGITVGSQGSDYSQCKYKKYTIENVTEYPVTILECKSFIRPDTIGLKQIARSGYHMIKKSKLWLRPNTNGNLNEMKYLLKRIKKENLEYAEFMIHSSEFMPGGGPKHQGDEAVEKLFYNMEELFKYATKLGYVGATFNTWESSKNLE